MEGVGSLRLRAVIPTCVLRLETAGNMDQHDQWNAALIFYFHQDGGGNYFGKNQLPGLMLAAAVLNHSLARSQESKSYFTHWSNL